MVARPTSAALSAVRLSRAFGDGAAQRVALRQVSLELKPGTLALLMGPSGSGKSTLLAILSGLLAPDSGQVLADDDGRTADVWAMTDTQRDQFRRKHTGFIFQGYNLFPALSAVQQLEIVLKWGQDVPHREARDRAAAMLERLGLKDQMHKRPAQLSGGEKQRVAVGRALVKGPGLLFADEPTAALDWENGQQVVGLLAAAAHDRGAAVLVVSHDHRLLPLVDEAYHLEDGNLTRTPTGAAHP